MSKSLKGQDVNLFVDGKLIAASTSCSFDLTANTTDAASKTDPGNGMWDNSEFTYYDWTVSNESFVVDPASLTTLLTKVVSGDATVHVTFQMGEYQGGGTIVLGGDAIITQLQLQAANGDYAKLSLSMDGCTALTKAGAGAGMIPELKTYPKIKGKALMIAMQDDEKTFHTLAAATSHTLTLSVQASDDGTKDDNDNGNHKEVTGKSISMSSENVLRLKMGTDSVSGIFASEMLDVAMTGRTVRLAFGYYPDSVGKDAGATEDWGQAPTTLIQGDFICSSINLSGNNKENATYTAEFTGKGEPSLT
ncbi:MAG: phage tail protein [Bacteroides sp.]|nr:phage tail protein [Bacteroides sp.]MCM1448287.1 phage tail protein [Bacteroides sp.]